MHSDNNICEWCSNDNRLFQTLVYHKIMQENPVVVSTFGFDHYIIFWPFIIFRYAIIPYDVLLQCTKNTHVVLKDNMLRGRHKFCSALLCDRSWTKTVYCSWIPQNIAKVITVLSLLVQNQLCTQQGEADDIMVLPLKPTNYPVVPEAYTPSTCTVV